MVTAADQGTIVTLNGGKSWSDWYNQPTGQFYHVETDDRFPYWIYSGQQDSGTAGAATRSDFGQLTYRDWHPVGGEERGWDVPDPRDPEIVYGSGLGGTITRFDARTGQVRNVSPAAESTYGRRPVAGLYRWSWVFPIAMSKTPPHALYAGAQYLLRSLDDGATLGEGEPGPLGRRPGREGLRGRRDARERRGPAVTASSSRSSSRRATRRRSGSAPTTASSSRTKDGGKTWKNVTPKGLPAWSKISTLDVSPLEPDVVYAAVDAHRRDDFTPHVYRTRDGGESWQEISTGLPSPGFAMVVRADTVRRGLLYAGTDTGVFVSFDDGAHWQTLQQNLPTCWIGDLQVHGADLVIATQGRGLWVARRRDAAAPGDGRRRRSLPPRSSLRRPRCACAQREPRHAAAARDARSRATRPRAPSSTTSSALRRSRVRIEILDGKGATVRAFSSDDPPEKLEARRYFTDLYIHPPAPPSTAAGPPPLRLGSAAIRARSRTATTT